MTDDADGDIFLTGSRRTELFATSVTPCRNYQCVHIVVRMLSTCLQFQYSPPTHDSHEKHLLIIVYCKEQRQSLQYRMKMIVLKFCIKCHEIICDCLITKQRKGALHENALFDTNASATQP